MQDEFLRSVVRIRGAGRRTTILSLTKSRTPRVARGASQSTRKTSISETRLEALLCSRRATLAMPQRLTGFVMGMWYLTSSVAGFTGAFVASFTALPKSLSPGTESLMVYTQVFLYVGSITLVVALLLWLISPRLVRLMGIATHH